MQDLDKNHANPNGKRERGISATLLRAGSKDGTQSLFSIPSKRLSIHADVPKEKVGWIRSVSYTHLTLPTILLV